MFHGSNFIFSVDSVVFADEYADSSTIENSSINIQVATRSYDDSTGIACELDDESIDAEEISLSEETNTLNVSSSVTGPVGAIPATEEDIAKASTIPDEIVLETNGVEPRASWVYLDNTFSVYKQLSEYNCGPACVQAALKYLTGSTPSQSTIATACYTSALAGGTRLAEMETYINNQQSVRTYIPRYNTTKFAMQNCLYIGVYLYDAPSIIGLSFSAGDDWLYSSAGHYVTVYGVMSDKSSFRLGDPWLGYSGISSSWSYTKSVDVLYAAYSNISIGFMY